MSERENLTKEYKALQIQYAYYIMALAAASIGFSVNLSVGLKKDAVHIILGIAIALWMISIYCGLKYVKTIGISIGLNITAFDIAEGRSSQYANNPQGKTLGMKITDAARNQLETKVKRYIVSQRYCLYFGVLLFLVWRLFIMMEWHLN